MDVHTYIDIEYKQIKCIVQRNCWSKGIKFDEDVFEETLTKCLTNLKEDKTIEGFRAYILVAYNNNLYRESQYAYNSKRSYTIDIPTKSTTQQHDFIYDELSKKYGDHIIMYFKEWLAGYSVREIEERHHEKGLTYKFKKIKEYIAKEYA